MNDSELLYKYKNTTLVQPEVSFGVYPPLETEKKLVSRYVYRKNSNLVKRGSWELKEFVKEQYWVLIDFFHGQPGGGEREISYTRETGLELQSFKEISSKMDIRSSQEVGVDGFKLRNEVSNELSRLTGERVNISEKTSKQHITKIPPQPFEWYFAIYQLIDVYTINKVQYRPKYTNFLLESIDYQEKQEEHREKLKKQEADYLAKINFESGLKKHSNMSDLNFELQTFEVPTLYFCEKFDPPLK